jgi:hypothetical protein
MESLSDEILVKELIKRKEKKLKKKNKPINLEDIFPKEVTLCIYTDKETNRENIEEILMDDHDIDLDDMSKEFRDNILYIIEGVEIKLILYKDGNCKVLETKVMK